MKTDGGRFAFRSGAAERWQRLLFEEQHSIRIADGREKQINIQRVGHVEQFCVVGLQVQFARQQPPDEGSNAPLPAVGDLRHARLARHPSRHVGEARRQQIEGLGSDLIVAVAAVADQPLDELWLVSVSVREPDWCHNEADRGRWRRPWEPERIHEWHDQRGVISETQPSQEITINRIASSQQRNRLDRLTQRHHRRGRESHFSGG